jgi:hypothetical protein
MASVLHPDSMASLPLIQRVQAFSTMVEGKSMHNAQVTDLDTHAIDAYVNKGLKAITGLISTTQLRCDLGVLPAKLVVHRNALYYWWHLRRRVWFRHHLPDIAHLPPIARLTSMVLEYPDLILRDADIVEQDQWRSTVRDAILKRAVDYYDTSDYQHLQLFPYHGPYRFRYRGQAYLNHNKTTDLGQIAIELRHDRLCGVDNAWEYHPCVFCGMESGLNGQHLLQCQHLPANLATERARLITRFSPELSLPQFATNTFACAADLKSPLMGKGVDFLCHSLTLGRKIMRYARRMMADRHDSEPELVSEPDLPDIYQDKCPPLCSLQSLSSAS